MTKQALSMLASCMMKRKRNVEAKENATLRQACPEPAEVAQANDFTRVYFSPPTYDRR